LFAQVEGHGEHGGVGGGDAADVRAAGAGGFVAFQGAVADVFAAIARYGESLCMAEGGLVC
jgi:hypothetical protein